MFDMNNPNFYGGLAGLAALGQAMQPSRMPRSALGDLLQVGGAFGQGRLGAQNALATNRINEERLKIARQNAALAKQKHDTEMAQKRAWQEAMARGTRPVSVPAVVSEEPPGEDYMQTELLPETTATPAGMAGFSPEQMALAGIMGPEEGSKALFNASRDIPDPLKQYQFALGQGFKGNYLDFQKAMAEAKRDPASRYKVVTGYDQFGNPRPYLADVMGGNVVNPAGAPTGAPQSAPSMSGPPSVGEKQVDTIFAKDVFVPWTTGKRADAIKNRGQIGSAITILERNPGITGGKIQKNAPDLALKNFYPDTYKLKQQVEEVVQRNLREILGAQFTEREGERLISRAFDVALRPEDNARRLRALAATMQEAIDLKDQAIAYFQDKRTLRGYKAKYNLTHKDIEDIFERKLKEEASPSASKVRDEKIKSLLKRLEGNPSADELLEINKEVQRLRGQ